MPRQFFIVLANTLVASVTNTLVWFSITFWVYLETRSVIATSVMAGVYLVTVAVSGFLLGAVVDRYKKKTSMLLSSLTTLLLYAAALVLYISTPPDAFTSVTSVTLWVLVMLTFFGAIAGNLRGIALFTLVTLMIPVEYRARANGFIGTSNGIAFAVASVFSGLIIGFWGMTSLLVLAVGATLVILIHLWTLRLDETRIAAARRQEETQGETDEESVEAEEASEQVQLDLRGTIRTIVLVPGLVGLIIFQTFNNFLGGVFMSLMDPYGLELVSVQVWGILWGFLSLGFIVGGLIVARGGLGKNPLRTLFRANIVIWAICAGFTLYPSIIPLVIGMFIFLCLMPAIEAAEQTILQRVIPPQRQGRVFGFAQSIEQAASPLTAFMIGPIAELIFIPFMTTGAGAELIGRWFGTGIDRGLALLFTIAGLLGLAITVIAMRTNAYRALSTHYQKLDAVPAETEVAGEPHPQAVGVEKELVQEQHKASAIV